MTSGGGRACHGGNKLYLKDDWKDLLLFHEYFHAETGRGCGARLVINNNNHQIIRRRIMIIIIIILRHIRVNFFQGRLIL